jgi:hypothetical protein
MRGRLMDEMDRMFEGMSMGFPQRWASGLPTTSGLWSPVVDVFERDDAVELALVAVWAGTVASSRAPATRRQ